MRIIAGLKEYSQSMQRQRESPLRWKAAAAPSRREQREQREGSELAPISLHL